MKEEWKYIKGYNDRYMISNIGNVKSLIKEPRILKFGYDNNYYYVFLAKNGKCKKAKIHRLVAMHFISNPHNKPQVNHIDGNKLNNEVSNLEWVTDAENRKHAVENGLMSRGVNHVWAKLSMRKAREIRKRYKNGCRITYLARDYKVCRKTISEVLNNNTWKERKISKKI